MPNASRGRLFDYVKEHVFEFNDRSASGLRPLWNFEFRPHLLDTRFLHYVSRAFWEEHHFDIPVQFCGLEFSGIPLSLEIARAKDNDANPSNVLAFRKSKKSATNLNAVEGFRNSTPVVIVDDILSSGKSVLKAKSELESMFAEVHSAFVIVDFERDDIDRSCLGIEVTSLFKLSDFGIEKFEIYE
jgi:orotate phosphoribosyltransferase